MIDAIILSDIHLGSSNCQAKRLCAFLEDVADGNVAPDRLILNGDVFDSIDFRRLDKAHWKVLSLMRKLSKRLEVIWISGNHDGSAEVVSHLLGVTVVDDYILETGGEKVLVFHGHAFDDFLDAHPILTWVGDVIYWLLQRIDRTHRFAKLAKKGSKTFLRCARKIEDGAVALARERGCGVVCCGHTHHPYSADRDGVRYHNTGCWTELPCTYLEVEEGQVTLRHFGDVEAKLNEPAPTADLALAS